MVCFQPPHIEAFFCMSMQTPCQDIERKIWDERLLAATKQTQRGERSAVCPAGTQIAPTQIIFGCVPARQRHVPSDILQHQCKEGDRVCCDGHAAASHDLPRLKGCCEAGSI